MYVCMYVYMYVCVCVCVCVCVSVCVCVCLSVILCYVTLRYFVLFNLILILNERVRLQARK